MPGQVVVGETAARVHAAWLTARLFGYYPGVQMALQCLALVLFARYRLMEVLGHRLDGGVGISVLDAALRVMGVDLMEGLL